MASVIDLTTAQTVLAYTASFAALPVLTDIAAGRESGDVVRPLDWPATWSSKSNTCTSAITSRHAIRRDQRAPLFGNGDALP
ncbi:hypothetical protein [Streptomyces sp. NPDC002779]|uniref:hypothetical protein n=1 Tax=Streptomyces sp. NPDC002779 TaxID=3364664 RepID=UPI00367F5095